MCNTIEFLKTLPENSGQKVKIKTLFGYKEFYFMWFLNKETIDLKPVDNINIVCINKRHWNKIELIND